MVIDLRPLLASAALLVSIAGAAHAQLTVGLNGGAVRYETYASPGSIVLKPTYIGSGSIGLNPDLVIAGSHFLFDVNAMASTASHGTQLLQGGSRLWGPTPPGGRYLQ